MKKLAAPMKSLGNLILMTLICLVIFWIFMALRPAHAEANTWWSDCRHGWIAKEIAETDQVIDQPVHVINGSARITYDELRKLLKDLPKMTPEIKACDAYRKCTHDRAEGKVKHCSINDRRWRKYIDGGW